MGIFDQSVKSTKKHKYNPIPPTLQSRWTKEEVKQLIKLWPNFTVQEICSQMNRTPMGVQRIVYALRKMGVHMEKKGTGGPKLKDIIKEVLEELKLPYNK